MIELIPKLVEFLEKLTFKKIVIIVIIGSIIAFCFPLIDYYFYFNIRTSSRIEVLDKLSKLNLEAIKENVILLDEYNSILEEIQEHNRGLSIDITSIINTQASKNTNLYKFLTGGFWAWLIVILSPFIYKKQIKDIIIAILVFGLSGALLGWISTIIPTFTRPIYNYVGFPILQLTIGIVIGVRISRRVKEEEKVKVA